MAASSAKNSSILGGANVEGNAQFLAKAPPDVVQTHQAQLTELTQQIELLQSRLQQLQ